MQFHDGASALPTPCLLVDEQAFTNNIEAMAAQLPGRRLRPHVKAFKSTAIARRLAALGHTGFTCATLAEVEGMAAAGLGEDLLLANETLDVDRLRSVASLDARVTIAVDSSATVQACADAGIAEVLIDVNVGLPRCGCAPGDAAGLAELARSLGMTVRGVMGYEGHLMMVEEREKKEKLVSRAMALLRHAADEVGGDVISAGGTGTYDTNTAATEIQAGSYTLMDTDYAKLDSPFMPALWLEATVISTNVDGGWIVADGGIKSLGMDHGNPQWPHGKVMFCSDEHTTLAPDDITKWSVGDRVRLMPAHVDPTVAKHERMWLIGDDGSATEWPVDLRHW